MMRSSGRPSPHNVLLDGSGRVALVTGAAGGIGVAVVAAFAVAGAEILAVDRLPGWAGEGHREGEPHVVRFAADLAVEAEVVAAVDACLARFGRLDYLIHCAGATGVGPLVDLALAEWQRLMDVNLTSAFLLARQAFPALKAAGGSLVLMSSPNGVHGGTPLSGPAYAAAKAGVLNLARYLAKEWAVDGVRVNCILPGTVDTPMLDRLGPEGKEKLVASIPLGRLTAAREVAAAAAFLCSDHAANMTGGTINISGGRLLL